MFLIVGLGNPGEQYERTPHNAGFMAMDALAAKFGLAWLPKYSSLLITFQAADERGRIVRALFQKPQLFMNRSGMAIAEVARFLKIKPADVIVAHDELDLPLGGFKMTFDKTSAGHKGVQSIIAALGTTAFWRIRIGVMPAEKPKNVDAYLTDTPLTPENAAQFEPALTKAVQAIELTLKQGPAQAMIEANRK